MRETNRVARYIVEFNQLTSQVSGFGNGALKHQFYKGLPSQIKDEIAQVGKPATLAQLCILAQNINLNIGNEEMKLIMKHTPPSQIPIKISLIRLNLLILKSHSTSPHQ